MSLKHAAIAAAALLVVTLIGAYLLFRSAPLVDDNFNNEFGLLLQDFEGKDVHLYEYRRQLLVAYAWASWCTYCADELKRLAELKGTYGDKVQILAINRAEPFPVAKEFIDKLQVGPDITLLMDPNDSFFKSIGGYAMPETVFINESGDIVFHQRGPLDMPTLQARMKELID